MVNTLKLMAVLAHPDDECLGNGGIFAKYAAEGLETHLVTATRGERGWMGSESDNPGLDALGRMRETELLAAMDTNANTAPRLPHFVTISNKPVSE
jgi:LmbE family N-acetylglucosaminyl deacetylase